MEGFVTVDWYGLGALVASCAAAAGVGWQIWRAEQHAPKYLWRLSIRSEDDPDTHEPKSRTFVARLLGDFHAYEVRPAIWEAEEIVWAGDVTPHVTCDSAPIEVWLPARECDGIMAGVIWIDPAHFRRPHQKMERRSIHKNGIHQRRKPSVAPRSLRRSLLRNRPPGWSTRRDGRKAPAD